MARRIKTLDELVNRTIPAGRELAPTIVILDTCYLTKLPESAYQGLIEAAESGKYQFVITNGVERELHKKKNDEFGRKKMLITSSLKDLIYRGVKPEKVDPTVTRRNANAIRRAADKGVRKNDDDPISDVDIGQITLALDYAINQGRRVAILSNDSHFRGTMNVLQGMYPAAKNVEVFNQYS